MFCSTQKFAYIINIVVDYNNILLPTMYLVLTLMFNIPLKTQPQPDGSFSLSTCISNVSEVWIRNAMINNKWLTIGSHCDYIIMHQKPRITVRCAVSTTFNIALYYINNCDVYLLQNWPYVRRCLSYRQICIMKGYCHDYKWTTYRKLLLCNGSL